MFIIYGYQGAGIWEIIIITVMSSHRMDKHFGLWRMHTNNTIFKSHHIVIHIYSKIKYINMYMVAVKIKTGINMLKDITIL